jgi:long-chain acyl-CoA synthetase
MKNGILDDFLRWESERPNDVFLRQPLDGTYKIWTYADAGIEIRKIASGLLSLGLDQGSHIAILSKNCAHWIMFDLAILYAGHVSIPIYPTLTASSIRLILEHSESKCIFIGKLDDFKSQKTGIPAGVSILGIDIYGSPGDYTWESWINKFEPSPSQHLWSQEDVFTIMYTSGTTGKPKGVMHSINAFQSTVSVAIQDLRININVPNRMFSYLPLSHIAERIGIESVGLRIGAEFSFAESLDTFSQNLAETRPTVFFAVPRIWAKFREKIEQKLPPAKMNLLLSIPLINNIIRKSIRKKLGLIDATHIFSGAAPITVDHLKWFEKLGVNILQAYGMTEDCVYAHFNRNENNRFGTVGLPLTGLNVKIADDGEIRVKCPGLTIGYYKEPEMTAELFDSEGFLKTGDKGSIDSDGFLTITGRVKDQFKTDKGKYISPAPIEMLLATNSDIESVCVVGMGVPQPIALVVLSLAGKAKSKSELEQSLMASITEINPKLESQEKIAKAIIMKEDWTIENSLLTPTLKVKRNELEQIYLGYYPIWYQMQGTVIWVE